MMTKEGYTKIVNFMTPGAVIFVLGRGQISHIVSMHYFLKNLRGVIKNFVDWIFKILVAKTFSLIS